LRVENIVITGRINFLMLDKASWLKPQQKDMIPNFNIYAGFLLPTRWFSSVRNQIKITSLQQRVKVYAP